MACPGIPANGIPETRVAMRDRDLRQPSPARRSAVSLRERETQGINGDLKSSSRLME
jgi:hypothetical protein